MNGKRNGKRIKTEWEEKWEFEGFIYGRTIFVPLVGDQPNSTLISHWVELGFSYT